MVLLVGMAAFAIDIGYLAVARTELQRTADAAAMAACWELADERLLQGEPHSTKALADCRRIALEYALENPVCGSPPTVDPNYGNAVEGEVVIGYLANPTDRSGVMQFDDITKYNAVTVRVRRNGVTNPMVPLFFARLFGIHSGSVQAEATAALHKNISGFQERSDGGNLNILPIALEEQTWDNLVAINEAGQADETNDKWTWDVENEEVCEGGDGLAELWLYPGDIESSGNWGTVDIGGQDNSTAVIVRQILEGITPEDLEHHGGSLEFDENGELDLNGDTGLSVGLKDELAQIIGEPRVIPIFSRINGSPGNNLHYTIVRFVGIRIMEVFLTGNPNNKRLVIQPAEATMMGTITSTTEGTSDLVSSTVTLVR